MFMKQEKCAIINLSPQECSDINNNICKKIKKKFENKCSKEYGYVTNIENITDISCVKMLSSGTLKYKVTYSFKFLKPTIDKIYPATVFLVSDERKAIMCNIENTFNVLVEMKNLKKKDIHVNETISVQLTDIEYNNFYHTIGKQV